MWESHLVWWPGCHFLKDFPQLLLVSTGEWSALPSKSEVRVPRECYCTYVNGSFTVRGEVESESQVGWDEDPTQLGTHNITRRAQLPEEQSTWMWQSQTQGEQIACTTPSGIVHTSATVIIKSLQEWIYRVSHKIVHMGETMLTTNTKHFQQHMHQTTEIVQLS